MALYEIASNRRKIQKVDLQPFGNTISVEAESDNPFEDAQDVEVFTQANRGMGDTGPHRGARSRGIVTKPQGRERIVHAGRAKAVMTVAPAHRQHGAFIPGMAGLGADPVYGPPSPPPASQPTDWNALTQSGVALAQQAGQIYANQPGAAFSGMGAFPVGSSALTLGLVGLGAYLLLKRK